MCAMRAGRRVSAGRDARTHEEADGTLRGGERYFAATSQPALRRRLLTIDVVAVHTCGSHGVGRLDHHVHVLRLPRLVGGHSRVAQSAHELLPVGVLQRHGLAVRADAPGIVSRFADSARASPLFSIACHPPYCPASGLTEDAGSASFFTGARVLRLGREDHVRVGEQDAAHHLQQVAVHLLWSRRRRRAPRVRAAAGACAETISTQSTAQSVMTSVTNDLVRISEQRFHRPLVVVDERAIGFDRQRPLGVCRQRRRVPSLRSSRTASPCTRRSSCRCRWTAPAARRVWAARGLRCVLVNRTAELSIRRSGSFGAYRQRRHAHVHFDFRRHSTVRRA